MHASSCGTPFSLARAHLIHLCVSVHDSTTPHPPVAKNAERGREGGTTDPASQKGKPPRATSGLLRFFVVTATTVGAASARVLRFGVGVGALGRWRRIRADGEGVLEWEWEGERLGECARTVREVDAMGVLGTVARAKRALRRGLTPRPCTFFLLLPVILCCILYYPILLLRALGILVVRKVVSFFACFFATGRRESPSGFDARRSPLLAFASASTFVIRCPQESTKREKKVPHWEGTQAVWRNQFRSRVCIFCTDITAPSSSSGFDADPPFWLLPVHTTRDPLPEDETGKESTSLGKRPKQSNDTWHDRPEVLVRAHFAHAPLQASRHADPPFGFWLCKGKNSSFVFKTLISLSLISPPRNQSARGISSMQIPFWLLRITYPTPTLISTEFESIPLATGPRVPVCPGHLTAIANRQPRRVEDLDRSYAHTYLELEAKKKKIASTVFMDDMALPILHQASNSKNIPPARAPTPTPKVQQASSLDVVGTRGWNIHSYFPALHAEQAEET
ncbi:hypothetical protein B0H16DRAFT_1483716 [Mycena metata]|uniref:Uncharacterized protein n=1 Tax=Mycena metata TaxID=1033252 RepID=A0AAD7GQV1_9AGAR|nr:hypothetical protein B0H16DRAFT_1483716 [Mycena metata]